jgi:hypothetical protein
MKDMNVSMYCMKGLVNKKMIDMNKHFFLNVTKSILDQRM